MIGPDAPRQFTLQVSVAVRWWLYHLPFAPEAARFREEKLRPRLVTLLTADTIEFQVGEALVGGLGDDLNMFLARTLGTDVLLFFGRLQMLELLRVVPSSALVRSALVTTALHNIPFSDALAVTLAENSGSPLLVADESVYEMLKALEPLRPTLFVTWLPDYIDL